MRPDTRPPRATPPGVRLHFSNFEPWFVVVWSIPPNFGCLASEVAGVSVAPSAASKYHLALVPSRRYLRRARLAHKFAQSPTCVQRTRMLLLLVPSLAES